MIEGENVRSKVMQIFTQTLLKYGGLLENQTGDAAYGYFGAFDEQDGYGPQLLVVAQEFRLGLRNLARMHGVEIECGIAIGKVHQVELKIHQIESQSMSEKNLHKRVVKKFLSTTGEEIDLLFRLEKLIHDLPGSNIIVTASVFESLNEEIKSKSTTLGKTEKLSVPCHEVVYLIPSDFCKKEDLDEFVIKYFTTLKKSA